MFQFLTRKICQKRFRKLPRRSDVLSCFSLLWNYQEWEPWRAKLLEDCMDFHLFKTCLIFSRIVQQRFSWSSGRSNMFVVDPHPDDQQLHLRRLRSPRQKLKNFRQLPVVNVGIITCWGFARASQWWSMLKHGEICINMYQVVSVCVRILHPFACFVT